MATKRKAKKAVKAKPKKTEEQELVTIEGLAPKMQSFNLPHDIYCLAMGKCQCQEQEFVTSFYSKVDKQKHTVKRKKLMNKSLTVRYRHKETVHRAALKCPEVKAALESKPKRLRVRS